jgi:hypothetical protein
VGTEVHITIRGVYRSVHVVRVCVMLTQLVNGWWRTVTKRDGEVVVKDHQFRSLAEAYLLLYPPET